MLIATGFALTTTPTRILEPANVDRRVKLNAGANTAISASDSTDGFLLREGYTEFVLHEDDELWAFVGFGTGTVHALVTDE